MDVKRVAELRVGRHYQIYAGGEIFEVVMQFMSRGVAVMRERHGCRQFHEVRDHRLSPKLGLQACGVSVDRRNAREGVYSPEWRGEWHEVIVDSVEQDAG